MSGTEAYTSLTGSGCVGYVDAMSRRGGQLAISVVIALALTIGLAPAAQAQVKLTASQYPAKLVANQTSNQVFTLEGTRTIVCKKVTLEQGTFRLAEGEEGMVTLTPTAAAGYEECEVEVLKEKHNVSIQATGCAYTLRATATLEANKSYTGSFEISCAGSNEIAIRVWEGAVGTSTETCRYDLPGQLSGGSVSTEGTGGPSKFDLGFTLNGLSVTRAVGTISRCGSFSQIGTYSGIVLVKAFNASSVEINASIDME